jgi:hypothetical protein
MKKQDKQVKEEIKKQTKDVQIDGKSIIVSNSTAPNKKEINYLIQIDGLIEKCAEIKENIHICILGSNAIKWTQKHAFSNLVKELQINGAGNIKRYDDIDNKKINPEFDLNNTMIKFNLK